MKMVFRQHYDREGQSSTNLPHRGKSVKIRFGNSNSGTLVPHRVRSAKYTKNDAPDEMWTIGVRSESYEMETHSSRL